MNIDQPTNPNTAFAIKFWGVRGQVPAPGQETYRFGGNTSCLEINVGQQRLIFDGGTGLRVLGNALLAQMPVEAHLFFTHANWDRIQGFPFFVPAFVPINSFHIHGTATHEGKSFEEKLVKQMHGPNFPVPIQVMGAKLNFQPLKAGDVVELDAVKVSSHLLHHQHQAIGYRVTYRNVSVVYATDSDVENTENRHALAELARNADLLILNTPIPYSHQADLSAWQQLLNFATDINVKQLLFSTHDPNCHDQHLEKLEATLQASYPNVKFAKEGEAIAMSA
ncbi:MAG: MBL fold metallo-hydrolase [Limnothrix sp.]